MKGTEETNFTLTVIVNDDGSDVVDVDSAADVYVYACVCEWKQKFFIALLAAEPRTITTTDLEQYPLAMPIGGLICGTPKLTSCSFGIIQSAAIFSSETMDMNTDSLWGEGGVR